MQELETRRIDKYTYYGGINTGSSSSQIVYNEKLNRIYIPNSSLKRIDVWNKDGVFLFHFGSFTGSSLYCDKDDNGNIYITDSYFSSPDYYHYIRVYDEDGNHIADWGGIEGSGDSKFWGFQGLSVYENNLYVMCYQTAVSISALQIKVYDLSFVFNRKFNLTYSGGSGFGLQNLAIYNDYFYSVDRFAYKVYKIDSLGVEVKNIGSMGDGIAEFNFPNTLKFDSKNRLFVTDLNNERLQIFDENLNYLDQISETSLNVNFQLKVPRAFNMFIDQDDSLYVMRDASAVGEPDLNIFLYSFEYNINDYISSSASLFPNGFAWIQKKIINSSFYKLLKAISFSFFDLDKNITNILNEIDISKTEIFLTDWEKKLQLPSEYIDIADTKAQRRQNILAILRSHIVYTEQDWIDIAKILGFDIIVNDLYEISSFPWTFPFIFGGTDEENAFTIVVTFLNIGESNLGAFPWTFPHTFYEDTTKYVRGIFDMIKPAYINILYRYE